MRLTKKLVILTIISIMVNASFAYGWGKILPGVPLFLKPEIVKSKTVEIKSSPKPTPLPIGEPVEADSLANQLIAALPSSALLNWNSVSLNGSSASSVYDSSCPSQSPVYPVISKSKGWRKDSLINQKGNQAGFLLQVSVYSAGMGATAMDFLKTQAQGCNGTYMVSPAFSTPIGIESIDIQSYNTPKAETVFFREGDIVGMATLRGSGIKLESFVRGWQSQWDPILGSKCLDINSTIDDSTRSPLSGNYKGRSKIKNIRLDNEASLAASATAQILIAENNTPSTDPKNSLFNSIPKNEGSLPVVLDAPVVPTNLSVTLDLVPATPGVAPTFPLAPDNSQTVLIPQPDPAGPGCGWVLTGEIAPIFKSDVVAQKQADQLLTKLLIDTSSWIYSKWQYSVDIKTWLAVESTYNDWTKASNERIALAEWSQYDSLKTQYDLDFAKYNSLYNDWAIANPTCALTSNRVSHLGTKGDPSTSSPAPTDSPTPTVSASPSCPAEPVAPIEPLSPTSPRP
jgi:hypothetical protein